MSTLFTKIINQEIPSYKIFEDDSYYAFLDINPLYRGHTLVVPKIEVDYIFNLDNTTLSGLILVSKKIGLAIKKVISCQRIGISVVGLEVPHVHIHLIPLNSVVDMNFERSKLRLSTEELTSIAKEIRYHLK